MKRTLVIAPCLAVLLAVVTFIPCQAVLACEGCFQHSYDYVKQWERLGENHEFIAAAIWFAAYSMEPVERQEKRDISKELPEPARAEEGIVQYFSFWNKVITHVPLAEAERKAIAWSPDRPKTLEVPLVTVDNTVYVHVMTTNTHAYVDFCLDNVSFKANGGNLPSTVKLVAYAVPLASYGGKMEGGLGYDLTKKLTELLAVTIPVAEGTNYCLRLGSLLPKPTQSKSAYDNWTAVVLKVSLSGNHDDSRRAAKRVTIPATMVLTQ